MDYAIALISCEVIPGVKPMSLTELYKCDILYYIKLINRSRNSTGANNNKNKAFYDGLGL